MNCGAQRRRAALRRGRSRSPNYPCSRAEQRDEVEMLCADVAHPAFRRAREPAISSAENRRLLSSLHRPGSGRGRRGRGDAARRLSHHRLSRSCPRAGPRNQRRMPAWRSFSEKRPAARAGSAVRCIFSTRNITCMAGTRLSARMFRSRAGWLSPRKYRKEDRVTLCFFGDGAINQGAFHEALNLAALFKLPVIFICENNLFAMGTSVKRSTSLKQIVDRAEGYDIPGEIIDGMNFREVRDKLWRDRRFDPQGSASGVCRGPHLSLSRPFDVRSGELSDQGGAGEISAGRSDHAVARAAHPRRQTDQRAIRSRWTRRRRTTALASVKFAEESPEPPLEKLYDYTYVEASRRPVSRRA